MRSDFGDLSLDIPEPPTVTNAASTPILYRLREPLHLHVGEDRDGNRGIIGRRVTMCRVPSSGSLSPTMAVAEGIVGFNSLPRAEAAL